MARDTVKDGAHWRCPESLLRTTRRFSWFFAALTSAGSYACMTLTVRSLSDDIGTIEMVTARASVSVLLSVIVMCYNGTQPYVAGELKFHLVNTLLTALSILAQFYAYQNMPVANACAIIYGYVAFIGVFARIIVKEPFGCFEVTSVILTFLGVLLISRPPFLFQFLDGTVASDRIDGVLPPLVAFSGTLSIALHLVTLRVIGKNDINSMRVVFCSNFPIVVISAVVTTILQQWTIPSYAWVRFRVFLAALSGFLGYVFLILAMSLTNALRVSLIMLNEVLIVFVISLSFGFIPQWTSIGGIFLIMGSSVAIIIRQLVKRSTETNEWSSESNNNQESEIEDEETKIPPRAELPNMVGVTSV